MVAAPRHDPATTRAWEVAGTQRLLALVDALGDDALGGASLLPGWRRSHVVAHVARNAEALARLATWARTGVETPMYASREARDGDIERSSQQSPAALRADLRGTAAVLEDALDGLVGEAWDARVVAGQGREVRAAMLPWLRTREVWLHAADLDAPGGPEAALAGGPPRLLHELLSDVTRTVGRAEACPPVRLEADDEPGAWSLGPDAPDAVLVRGRAVRLLLWVSGRGPTTGLATATGAPLPVLPRWL
ncbi:maleylpyruvate isomerase family mycothiol-dependent enzyme [Aquipuribacter nitratireducens]|uniref:maleylpyruvate isomerase family mycothiol-dependent enzyme n=1 Tax=Aquipuribacter nitratireducens TaxID=650104 RepID=UPI0030ED37DF